MHHDTVDQNDTLTVEQSAPWDAECTTGGAFNSRQYTLPWCADHNSH